MTVSDLKNEDLQDAVKLLAGVAQAAGFPVLITKNPSMQLHIKLPAFGPISWHITPGDLFMRDFQNMEELPEELSANDPHRHETIRSWLMLRAVTNARCPKCGNEWTCTPPVWTRFIQCPSCKEVLTMEEDRQE